MVKLIERQNSKAMVERSSPARSFLFLCHMTNFPLLGKDKFPLGVEYIFESKFPLVVRIGLAARACGSGNGQSPSNSAISTHPNGKSPYLSQAGEAHCEYNLAQWYELCGGLAGELLLIITITIIIYCIFLHS